MVTITPKAAEKLLEVMADENKSPDNTYLRVFVQGGGCSGFQYGLAVEEALQDTDKIFESNGIKVIVDPISVRYLDGAEVDFVDGLTGGFKINNPNAKSTCGCGSSFNA
ncbi:MAG: iron-sulfur cluster insertion protein ErpA [Candidatus Yanofskybacteria bacterium]|nr:iron-sulfur cluster insertion protein ErpA [Candidatus Yanofskybacteria bacterium]